MKYLFILNDQPYGTERSYNGLRLENALAEGAHRSTLDELAAWTQDADRVLVF
jgi:sulfur relay (sulfurtransferase) complex TusBCD TusD component (DsrE family)